MRFIFDKFSVFIIVSIFLMISMFGFIMNYESRSDFYGEDGFDAKEDAPDDVVQFTRKTKTLFEIPPASFGDEDNDLIGEFTLWHGRKIRIPWFNIDFEYSSIFPNIYSGYDVITDEVSDAPFIIQIILYAIPLTLLFVVLRSLEVGV